jgi:hypothetical protein
MANSYEADADDVPEHSVSIRFYPQHSRVLPDGRLRMATSGIAKSGE